mmetsp:Transcript_7178/g.13362  ORF Transcript_7178/g.13362 Transcript_7178/m.13362 type:complete len:198 (+) Transcript_7178:49-642(+)
MEESTPRKVTLFNASSPPNKVDRASPQWAGIKRAPVFKNTPMRKEAARRRQERYAELEQADYAAAIATDASAQTATPGGAVTPKVVVNTRPTTSRHIPRPSPENFHDYVVPSPKKDGSQKKTVLKVWNGGTLFVDDFGGGDNGNHTESGDSGVFDDVNNRNPVHQQPQQNAMPQGNMDVDTNVAELGRYLLVIALRS